MSFKKRSRRHVDTVKAFNTHLNAASVISLTSVADGHGLCSFTVNQTLCVKCEFEICNDWWFQVRSWFCYAVGLFKPHICAAQSAKWRAMGTASRPTNFKKLKLRGRRNQGISAKRVANQRLILVLKITKL
jgi:hypothetical protein